MYRILLADDSALVRKVICDIIATEDNFEAAGICMDGQSAYEKIVSESFDVVILETYLPKMNGVEVLEKMRSTNCHVPVIILSSALKEDVDTTFLAMEYGAIEFVVRPFHFFSAEREAFERHLKTALNAAIQGKTSIAVSMEPLPARSNEKKISETMRAAGIAIERSRQVKDALSAGKKPEAKEKKKPVPKKTEPKPVSEKTGPVPSAAGTGNRTRLIAIASSTGGPQALHTLIPMLPAHLGVPVVIVQHMPNGFTESLAERINQKSAIRVQEAMDGQQLQPDVVYIAPGGRHLEIVEKTPGRFSTRVFDDPPVNNLRPCADVMFRSLCKCSYDEVICVVLTGMGADGSQGIASLGQKKAIYVITQSEETCVVYGMPKAADRLGLSDESVPITEIAKAICRKLGV